MGNQSPKVRFKRPDDHIQCNSTSFSMDFIDVAQSLSNGVDFGYTTPYEERQPILGSNYRQTNRYIFFDPNEEGFLDQWYKATMVIDDVQYDCCEQFVMVEKA